MPRWIVWVGPILIVLVSCVLYSSSGDHSRLIEDETVIWKNKAVTGESFGPALLGRFYSEERSFHQAIRPLSTVVQRSNFGNFGQRRSPYQWTQILLHGLAGLLLALSVSRTLRAPLAGVMVGLIFVCHAALTQSVLRLAGISEILALCFSMVAILGADRAFQPRDPRDGRHRVSLSLCWLAVLFAIWSKEVAVVIVPALLLWASAVSRSQSPKARQTDRFSDPFVLSVGVVLAAAVALGYRMFAVGTLPETVRLATEVYPDTGVAPAERFLLGLSSIPTYLRLLFFPDRLGTSYDFLGWIKGSELQVRSAVGGGVLLVLLVGTSIAWARRHVGAVPWWTLALGGFVAALGVIAPTGDFLNERSVYFILPGVVALIAAAFVASLSGRKATGAVPIAVVCLGLVAAIALGARTRARADDFSNQETLLRAQIATYPQSARARFDLGSLYLSRSNDSAARREYEEAVGIDPNLWLAWVNIGVTYSRENALSLAIRAYDRALAGMQGLDGYAGEAARTRFNKAIVLMKQNRNREAAEELTQTLQVFPDHLRAHANLGFIFSNSPKFDEQALYHLGRALELEGDPAKRTTLANVVRNINTRRADIDQERQDRINAGLGDPGEDPDSTPEGSPDDSPE